MKLKRASVTDINDLKEVCRDAYSQNFHHHWHKGGLAWYLDKEFSTERLTSGLKDVNTEYYFIESNLTTAGFLKIRTNSTVHPSIKNNIELEKIYILPEYKGNGIGKFVLNEVIKKALNRRKQHLFLCVIDTNTIAIKLYEKLGFKLHSKTTLNLPYFKEELKGMNRMVKELNLF